MKKFLYLVFVFLVCAVVSVLCAHGLHGAHASALAVAIPLMPRNLFSGKPSICRAIQLADGTWGEGGEVLHAPAYDRMRFLNSTGVNARSLFKTSVGQQRDGVTLTFADTNVEKSESVPTSQKWTFWGLNVYFLPIITPTDAQILLFLNYVRTTTIRCIIHSKDDMFRVPLWKFFGANQMISAPAVTVNSRFPQPVFTGTFAFNIPVVLQALTDWELKVEPLVASDAALDNCFLGFEFDGRRDRA
jgi:hypothetical protein